MFSTREPEPGWNSNVSCRHEFSAKQTTNQTFFFIWKQPNLCILFHLQARTFRCIKFSKPMGRDVFTSRKFLVKLPKFMNNDRDLSPVMNHARIKRHFLFWLSLPEYPMSPIHPPPSWLWHGRPSPNIQICRYCDNPSWINDRWSSCESFCFKISS